MPELHQRGVELVVDLLDAADNIDRIKLAEIEALLRETAAVLGDLLARISRACGITRLKGDAWTELAIRDWQYGRVFPRGGIRQPVLLNSGRP